MSKGFYQIAIITMEADPHPTLYINNINEKIKKDALKKLLYMLFSQYGKVRQIIACKGLKLRGQVGTKRVRVGFLVVYRTEVSFSHCLGLGNI